MEKFFKHEGVMTHNKSSNIASNTNTDRNKRCLYQARDVGYEYNEKGYTFVPDGSGALVRFEDVASQNAANNITFNLYIF